MKLIFKLTFSMFFCLMTIPAFAQAAGSACPTKDVKIHDKYNWKMAGASCSSGKGLWNKAPKNRKGFFWVQCGVTSKLPDKLFAGELDELVPSDKIVLFKEPKMYRCLVGPFADYDEALSVRDKMKTKKKFAEAFIRQVPNGKMVAEADKVEMAKPEEATPAESEMAESAAPPVTEPSKQIAETQSTEVGGRGYYLVGNLSSPMPIDNEPSYFEEDKKWLRASYEKAEALCAEHNKSVITLPRLKEIATDEQMMKHMPKRLPYWVNGSEAFDIVMRIPILLTQSSAVYVFCE